MLKIRCMKAKRKPDTNAQIPQTVDIRVVLKDPKVIRHIYGEAKRNYRNIYQQVHYMLYKAMEESTS